MSPPPLFLFAPFRLDPINARLWCGAQVLTLTPKAFAVLHYLVEDCNVPSDTVSLNISDVPFG